MSAALRLAIVADDLTGGLDAAAPFAARGAGVRMAMSPAAVPDALAHGPHVLVICTDSREIPADQARARVVQTLANLPGSVPLFKKIDSRLKGNIAAELAGFDAARLLVVPAIPDFGRIVRGGVLTGFGVDAPICVADRLGRHADHADIPDTVDSADIFAALAAQPDALPVGARGLAEALAARMFPAPSRRMARLDGPRALFVVGSRDRITLRQVMALADAGVVVVDAPNGVAPENPPDAPILAIHATPGPSDMASDAVASALAVSVIPLAAGRGTILLTGGATAQTVLSGLGIGELELLGECLPGLPVARASGYMFVTKSGGFGQPGTLADVLAMIASD